MLSKLNIKNKLKIFSISLLVIFAGVIGFNYLNSITINNEANNIKNNSLPTTIASYKILGFTSQIETVSLKHVTKDINAINELSLLKKDLKQELATLSNLLGEESTVYLDILNKSNAYINKVEKDIFTLYNPNLEIKSRESLANWENDIEDWTISIEDEYEGDHLNILQIQSETLVNALNAYINGVYFEKVTAEKSILEINKTLQAITSETDITAGIQDFKTFETDITAMLSNFNPQNKDFALINIDKIKNSDYIL